MGDADMAFGRFGNHRAVDPRGIQPSEEVLHSDAGSLLVRGRRDDHLTVDARGHGVAGRDQAGGQSCLHVVRPTGIQSITLDAGRDPVGVAADADGVEMAAQHEPTTAHITPTAQQHARAAGRTLHDLC